MVHFDENLPEKIEKEQLEEDCSKLRERSPTIEKLDQLRRDFIEEYFQKNENHHEELVMVYKVFEFIKKNI